MARDGANGGALLAEDECSPELIGWTGGGVRPPDLRARILEGYWDKWSPTPPSGEEQPDQRTYTYINSLGPVEVMDITLSHMPKNKEFDLFVIQQPNTPFGVSWYQGDIDTNNQGEGHGRFVGRFSIETFSVAPGSTAAPVVHEDPPFPDAATNPAFTPVHQFHLGLWFGSADAAQAAGCPDNVTPFNGDHTAGIQALSTRNFDALDGPLRRIN
jgi:hypothetical protein